MKPFSDLTGVIYLRVKDTVTTYTVCNGQRHKEDKQQQHYCSDGDGLTCFGSKDSGVKSGNYVWIVLALQNKIASGKN